MMGCLLMAGFLMAAEPLPVGQIVDEVSATADPAQRYALYLPSHYSPERAWPVILAFDPGGRGRRAVEQYQVAAEKFGYIIAGSNVSRNGSWSVSLGAAQAMGADVTARFAIDPKRIYTAGMSGGARVALGVALGAPTLIAGVVASSAGYPDSKPRKTLPFAVFGTAGTDDFNWLEMRLLDHALTSPHRLAVFDGGHVWLPSEVAVTAVEWLDVQAMKAGRLPRDEARLDGTFADRQAAALALGKEFERHQALEALAADFAGLRDVVAIRARATELHRTKAVKEALKQQQAEEVNERRQLDEILALEQELNAVDQRSTAFARLSDHWKRLATASTNGQDSMQRRIARRVTRGLSMGAGERTKDVEYLKLLANYRPARAGR